MTNYKKVQEYILDSITWDGYGIKEPTTDKEKLQFAFDTFKSEYQWNIDRIGFVKALTEYLQGLPGTFSIAFYNDEILDLAKEWGGLKESASEREEQRILNNYWNFMAVNIIKLWNKHKIN